VRVARSGVGHLRDDVAEPGHLGGMAEGVVVGGDGIAGDRADDGGQREQDEAAASESGLAPAVTLMAIVPLLSVMFGRRS
jgi:hypothetical protein